MRGVVRPLLIERGILLNFYPTTFYLKDPFRDTIEEYRAVEYRFQGMKVWCWEAPRSKRKKKHDEIRTSESCRQAKDMGRELDPFFREKWEQIAYGVMLEACLAKFTQCQEANYALVKTEDRTLYEHRRDPIWGDNIDGSGKNYMGKILMQVREVIR